MPIYEYNCEDCNKSFETLVLNGEEVQCPGCRGKNLIKQYSRFGLNRENADGKYDSLPLYKGGGCGCTPSTCGCKS